MELVREDPYRLAADIWGVGFQSADQLAERLGIDRASPLRARAALKYVLQSLSDEGHVGFAQAEVIERTGGAGDDRANGLCQSDKIAAADEHFSCFVKFACHC